MRKLLSDEIIDLLAYSGTQSLKYICSEIIKKNKKISEISFTSQYDNYCSVASQLKGIHLPMNYEATLDFVYLHKIFSNFLDSLNRIIITNRAELIRISKCFDNQDDNLIDQIDLLLCLRNNSVLNKLKIEDIDICNEVYSSIVNEVNECFSNFVQCFYLNAISDCNDRIMTVYTLLPKKSMNQKDIINIKNKKIIYFDKQVYNKYSNDKDFEKYVDNSKKDMLYVYSPYLFEDIIKSNELYLQKEIKTITKLTDNFVISEPEYTIKREDPIYAKERVKLFRYPTIAAEEKRVITYEFCKYKYPELKDFINKYKTWDEYLKIIKNDQSINELISEILLQEGFSFSIDQLLQYKISFKNSNEKKQCIEGLFDLFDILGFNMDSKEQRIKSGYQDLQHLICSSVTDFFITEDKKLKERAKVIFQYLSINTKVLNINEFYKLFKI